MKTIRSLLLLLAMSVSVSAFAQYIEGTTPLLAPVAPASALDTYASHTEEYGQGGFRSVADATARDAIPADRMKVGMLVHCLDTGTIFRLSASSNWVDSGIKAAGDWVATNLLAVASAEAGRTALALGTQDSVSLGAVVIGTTNVVGSIAGKQPQNVVADLTALAAYSGAADSVLVTDTLRGGTFSYAASGYTADGGNVVAAPGKGSGYWVRDNETRLINVRHFGAFGDGTTDDTVAITAAAAECTISTDVLYFPPGTYPVTNSITVVGGGVTMDAATLLAMWDASTQQPCLVLGVSGVGSIDRKYIGLRVARNTISSWTSTADVGVKIYYHNHSVFEILESVGFTVGVQVHQGHCNRFQLGRIGAAQYGFLVQSVSDVIGWNANNVYGGRFVMSMWDGGGTTKPGISRYAIAFNADYSYPSHDNVFHGPVVELNHSDAISGSPTSEATILLVEVGNRNLVDCVYVEEATYMLTSSGIARDNVVTYTCSKSMGSNAPYINEGSLYVNTVIPAYGGEQSVARYHIYDSGLLAQRCDQSGTKHSLPPELFGTSPNSNSPAELDSFSASTGDIVHDANGGYISLTGSTAAFGIRLDARYAKQFWLESDTDTSYHGRVYVRPLTSTFLIIPDDTGTVKGSYGVALSAYAGFMGSYGVSGSSIRMAHVFKCVDPDIRYIDFIFTGVTPMRLRSFAIYSDDPRAAVIPVRQSTEITYSDAAPMAGTWHKGDRIVNTSPDPGESAGWLCTTAGTFGAAITETANVSSDSPNSFYIVMSADTHTLQVGQYISGTGFNGRINRISADNLTVYLSRRNTAKPGAGQTVTYITPVFEPYGVIGWLATGTAPDGTTRPYAETSDGKTGPVDFGWRSSVTAQRTSLAATTKIVDESGDAIGNFDTGWTVGASWTTNSSAVVNATGVTNSLSHTSITALVGPPRFVTMTLVSGGAWTVDADASLTVTVGGSLMRTFTNADPPSGTMTISGMVDGSTDEVVFTVYAPDAKTVSGSFDNFKIEVLAAGDLLHRHTYPAAALVQNASAGPYFTFTAGGTHAANENAKTKVIALTTQTVTDTPYVLASVTSTNNGGSWRMEGKVYASTVGSAKDRFSLELLYTDAGREEYAHGTNYTVLQTYTLSLPITEITGSAFAWDTAGYFLIGANADTADGDVTINTSSVEYKP
jgi:hypothetical protein